MTEKCKNLKEHVLCENLVLTFSFNNKFLWLELCAIKVIMNSFILDIIYLKKVMCKTSKVGYITEIISITVYRKKCHL